MIAKGGGWRDLAAVPGEGVQPTSVADGGRVAQAILMNRLWVGAAYGLLVLGKRNWFRPAWLAWLPELHVEGTEGLTAVDARTGERAIGVIDLTRASALVPQEARKGP